MLESIPTRPALTVTFAALCWVNAVLITALLFAGANAAAGIIGLAFAMAFAGLIGCRP